MVGVRPHRVALPGSLNRWHADRSARRQYSPGGGARPPGSCNVDYNRCLRQCRRLGLWSVERDVADRRGVRQGRHHAWWGGYLAALMAVALVSALIGLVLQRVAIANISMLYLIAVLVTAIAFGHGPAILASV